MRICFTDGSKGMGVADCSRIGNGVSVGGRLVNVAVRLGIGEGVRVNVGEAVWVALGVGGSAFVDVGLGVWGEVQAVRRIAPKVRERMSFIAARVIDFIIKCEID